MQGKIVICYRFLDSTLAYQGYGLGIDIKIIRTIGFFASRGIKPDLTFFLDLPVEQGLRSCKGSRDRIENRSIQYHSRVRCGYLSLVRLEPGRFRVIRVQKEKYMTQRAIRGIIEIFLPRPKTKKPL